MISEVVIKVEPVCPDCRYYGGCDRTGNCRTTCEKWDLSSLALEDLIEELPAAQRTAIRQGVRWRLECL